MSPTDSRVASAVKETSRKARGRWSEEHLMTSDKSILIDKDIVKLLASPGAWHCLEEAEKREILSLLPADTHPNPEPNPDDPSSGIPPLPDSFVRYSNNWRDGIRQFQLDLQNGRYNPEWLRQAEEARIQRENGEFDAFKEREFEEFWGQKQKLNKSLLSGESSRVSLEALVDAGVIQIGDVWRFEHAFGKGDDRVLVEKEARVQEINGSKLTFVVPGGHRVFLSSTAHTAQAHAPLDANDGQKPELIKEPPFKVEEGHPGHPENEPDKGENLPANIPEFASAPTYLEKQSGLVLDESLHQKPSQEGERTNSGQRVVKVEIPVSNRVDKEQPKGLEDLAGSIIAEPSDGHTEDDSSLSNNPPGEGNTENNVEVVLPAEPQGTSAPSSSDPASVNAIDSAAIPPHHENRDYMKLETVMEAQDIPSQPETSSEPQITLDPEPQRDLMANIGPQHEACPSTASSPLSSPPPSPAAEPEADEVIIQNVATPNMLVGKILEIDGRKAGSRASNSWKEIRCYRKNQDMGSLWDVRLAWFHKNR
ncbi:hypothetical protein N7468_000334 [Penicillium chermesinum]|uniref:DEUBAD domain-containing protein n=1 Tax=Penicillium chermesinum TaxID=63820 RepID=A0A9W9TY94_9EURO|nr:uncharacterized protein N7468_000334 [Penicillium chermesinum]KAJ5248883.1 hypothetical protein N7468_000334 [Penicillium chermesinum]